MKQYLVAVVVAMMAISCGEGGASNSMTGPSGSGSGRASTLSNGQGQIGTGADTGTFPQPDSSNSCPSVGPKLTVNTALDNKVNFAFSSVGGNLRFHTLVIKSASNDAVVYSKVIEAGIWFWDVKLPNVGNYYATVTPTFVGCGAGTPSNVVVFSINGPQDNPDAESAEPLASCPDPENHQSHRV